MFDLPQPLGPTTTAIPWPGSVTSVRSQNDLNPNIWIFFSFSMNVSLSSPLEQCWPNGDEWP